jgi:hypothetical protein
MVRTQLIIKRSETKTCLIDRLSEISFKTLSSIPSYISKGMNVENVAKS